MDATAPPPGPLVVSPATARLLLLTVEEELALMSEGGLQALLDHYCSAAWRVPELRELCKARGLRRGGTKRVLAGRLVEGVRREVGCGRAPTCHTQWKGSAPS